MAVLSPSCYELLGVPADAPRPTLGRAWSTRRSLLLQRVGNLPVRDVDALVARLDESFQILADPAKARRYRQYQAADRMPTTPAELYDELPEGGEWDVELRPGDPDRVLTLVEAPVWTPHDPEPEPIDVGQPSWEELEPTRTVAFTDGPALPLGLAPGQPSHRASPAEPPTRSGAPHGRVLERAPWQRDAPASAAPAARPASSRVGAVAPPERSELSALAGLLGPGEAAKRDQDRAVEAAPVMAALPKVDRPPWER
jgi:hypothetical protein